MSRVQLALRVPDLDASVAFYTKRFGTEPAKVRPGYANFAIAEPPLKLVLIEDRALTTTHLDHLGVEVETIDQVSADATRLADLGLEVTVEEGAVCCYAVQNKVLVTAPGGESWETYVVLANAATLDKDEASRCCPHVPFPAQPVNEPGGKLITLVPLNEPSPRCQTPCS
jgi:catechol 2,3-dioxygenase-like lactoylglutathione lyase family enzyme